MNFKGQPLSGVTIIAKQPGQMKKNDQIEGRTGSDGTFRMKVLPDSEYVLSFNTETWKTEKKLFVRSETPNQIYILPQPVIIRFMISHDSIITDSKTGRQWIQMPEYSFSWDGAIDYAEKLRLSGHADWKMPARQELRDLYENSDMADLKETFHIGKNSVVWSSEPYDSRSVWSFDLLAGTENYIFRGNSMGTMAMVAVRSSE